MYNYSDINSTKKTMKAMILAAGMGTRLRPLTRVTAKALVPVVNIPLIDRIIDYLHYYGVNEIVVNAHYHHRKIINHFKEFNRSGVKLDVRVEQELLDTGGGIKNMEDFWGRDPFVVINGDTLTDIDLQQVYEAHIGAGNLVTMVLHDHPLYNNVMVDGEMNVLSVAPGKGIKDALAFTGVQVMNPEVLELMPEKRKFSVKECYLRLINSKRPLKGFFSRGHSWMEVGTIEDYMKANFYLLAGDSISKGPDSRLDSDCKVKDWAVIGEKSIVQGDALVERSVIWDNVIIRPGVRVSDSIITTGVIQETDIEKGVAVK